MPYIVGTPNADRLDGSSGDDEVRGLDGDDIIRGHGGADTLIGHGGHDDVEGAQGSDTIYGDEGVPFSISTMAGNDRLDGGQGNDFIYGGGGDDTMLGGPDADELFGGAGRDHVDGGDGNDFMSGFGEEVYNGPDIDPDVLLGGGGDDRIFVGYGDTVDGGEGNDTVFLNFYGAEGAINVDLRQLANNGSVTIAGATISGVEYIGRISLSQFDDVAIGGPVAPGPDGVEISGWGGNDDLTETAGVDRIYGGDGDDVLRGGTGSNPAISPSGDRLNGEAGNDRIYIAKDGAYAFGGTGDDQVFGGDGHDEIWGEGGVDTLRGGGNDDGLNGGDDDDFVYGESGSDTLIGEHGNDLLDGGAGADTMRGGAGNDIYVVDSGADLVFEEAGEGTDEIRTGLAVYTMSANVENLAATSDIAHDFRGNGLDNVLSGGAAGDLFRLQDGGADSAFGGDGNDGFLFGASFTAADKVDGGAGANDQVALQGDYSAGLTLGAESLVNVETLLVLPGFDYRITAVDANVPAGARLQIFGTTLGIGDDLTFDGSAERDGYFVVYGGAGKDTLTGGDGNDGFYFGPGNFSGTDVIHGGPGGNDQIGLDGHYSITLGGNFDGVETLILYRGPDGDLNRFDLATSDAAVAAGQRFTVFATTLGTGLAFNGSAESDGSFRFLGSAQADTLTGGQQGDSFFGGRGDDRLSGGGGNDVFLYQDVLESTAEAGDAITGFNAGDKIDLSAIDANGDAAGDGAFAFIGAAAFDGTAGQLRVVDSSGSWAIEGDVNGDKVADLVIGVTTDGGYILGAGDFVF